MADDNAIQLRRHTRKLRARRRFAALPRDERCCVFLSLVTASALKGDAGIAVDNEDNKYLVEDFRGFEFEGNFLK